MKLVKCNWCRKEQQIVCDILWLREHAWRIDTGPSANCTIDNREKYVSSIISHFSARRSKVPTRKQTWVIASTQAEWFKAKDRWSRSTRKGICDLGRERIYFDGCEDQRENMRSSDVELSQPGHTMAEIRR